MQKLLIVLSSLLILIFSGCSRVPHPIPEISPSDTVNQTHLTKLHELKKSCLADNSVSCYNLGKLYRASACHKIKNYSDDQLKYTDDITASIFWYSVACSSGSRLGCEKSHESRTQIIRECSS